MVVFKYSVCDQALWVSSGELLMAVLAQGTGTWEMKEARMTSYMSRKCSRKTVISEAMGISGATQGQCACNV